jgi:hypothetical protein
MPGIDDAKSIDELGQAALDLMTKSMHTYHDVSVATWKACTGAAPLDNQVLTKGWMTWMGNMARDTMNYQMVVQKAIEIATPAAPVQPDPKPGGPGDG